MEAWTNKKFLTLGPRDNWACHLDLKSGWLGYYYWRVAFPSFPGIFLSFQAKIDVTQEFFSSLLLVNLRKPETRESKHLLLRAKSKSYDNHMWFVYISVMGMLKSCDVTCTPWKSKVISPSRIRHRFWLFALLKTCSYIWKVLSLAAAVWRRVETRKTWAL